MGKDLISEQTVVDAAKAGQKILGIRPGTIVTAAARDRAASMGIRLVAGEKRVPSAGTEAASGKKKGDETVAIGSDHGGFQLKQTLVPFIESLGYKVVDTGTYSEEPCDYPDYAYMVARMVSLGEATKGVMVDSVGIASAIVANKVPGIRAACCHSEFAARSSREHNDANLLTLGGKVLGAELAKAVVKAWLDTWFGGGRHKVRIDKISEIERRFMK